MIIIIIFQLFVGNCYGYFCENIRVNGEQHWTVLLKDIKVTQSYTVTELYNL